MEAIPVPAITGQADVAGLVSRAAAGDEIAFTRIVAAHHDAMTRVAFIVIGDLDLADDAVAAAWSLAWRRLGSLREPDRLRAWLVSIAANEARRLGRERRRRNVVEVDIETQGELSGGADHGRRTAGDLDLVNALNRLSAEDRAPRTALRRGVRLLRARPRHGPVGVRHAGAPRPSPRTPPDGAFR